MSIGFHLVVDGEMRRRLYKTKSEAVKVGEDEAVIGRCPSSLYTLKYLYKSSIHTAYIVQYLFPQIFS
jgi:hypothetical protein